MDNVILDKINIYMFNEDVYILRIKGKFKVYDYNHKLINESKIIKNVHFVKLNMNCIYYWNPFTKVINKWDFIDDSYQKFIFTKHNKPEIKNIDFDENKIIIYYEYVECKTNDELKRKRKIAFYDHINQILLYETEYYTADKYTLEKLFIYNHKIFVLEESLRYSNHHCILYEWNRKSKTKLHIMNGCTQNLYKVSANGKYSLFATVDYNKNGQIFIFDFTTFKEIDCIKFCQEGFYTIIAYFFEYKTETYLVYQYNPIPEKEELWYTCIYSINKKSTVKIFEYRIAIESVLGKNLLIIQMAKNKKTIFYKY